MSQTPKKPFIERAPKSVIFVLFFVAVPLTISWLASQAGIAVANAGHVPLTLPASTDLEPILKEHYNSIVSRSGAAMIDIVAQGIYFSLILLLTRMTQALFIMLAYQAFIAFMFLDYGYAGLFTGIVLSLRSILVISLAHWCEGGPCIKVLEYLFVHD